eukprot:CAMPEP_0203767588 /NCGR_PEP_ID=MMETSP0099_2-20121227/1085_1 /ASSEMBLY_ACC=CAM_ASM_000209 /TAXON_ID=96639 /ORGANISM=" , Strain NY0313808BC1" /LENGTH=144 /DNA_ID=CAMNT_0050664123 /DNA_START=149 /DNA_END=583 /DNA_ORIENTATION=+
MTQGQDQVYAQSAHAQQNRDNTPVHSCLQLAVDEYDVQRTQLCDHIPEPPIHLLEKEYSNPSGTTSNQFWKTFSAVLPRTFPVAHQNFVHPTGVNSILAVLSGMTSLTSAPGAHEVPAFSSHPPGYPALAVEHSHLRAMPTQSA